jgi:hypothetical protein
VLSIVFEELDEIFKYDNFKVSKMRLKYGIETRQCVLGKTRLLVGYLLQFQRGGIGKLNV